MATPVKDEKETLHIATASASGDPFIGKTIADALQKVGKAGVITIEEGKSTDTTVEMVEGMQFDRGYSSAYFCTNAEAMTVELSHPRVLVTDKKISSIQEILSLLQGIASSGQPLLIIADDIEGDALSTLVVNRLRGSLKVCTVKAPGFGDRKKELLQDIAVLTGATLVTEEAGLILKDVSMEVLGLAEKIVITKDKTTIVGGSGKPDAIAARIKQIEQALVDITSSYDKDKLLERKAKLSGGVAVIRVGAPTEPEMKQKKQVFEDSLNSTRAALESGLVLGGGVALLLGAQAIEELDLPATERVGAKIVASACAAPFKQIVSNAGLDSSVILEQILAKGGNFGFNAENEKVEDLIKAGVVDPAKVVKHALIFASSTAGVILLSEALIADAKDDDETASDA
jgi:chaperonin GroEL